MARPVLKVETGFIFTGITKTQSQPGNKFQASRSKNIKNRTFSMLMLLQIFLFPFYFRKFVNNLVIWLYILKNVKPIFPAVLCIYEGEPLA